MYKKNPHIFYLLFQKFSGAFTNNFNSLGIKLLITIRTVSGNEDSKQVISLQSKTMTNYGNK